MKMYLLDLPNPKLEGLSKELLTLGAESIENIYVNLLNKDEIIKVIKRVGEKEKYIDILFNNAGIGSKCSITNQGTFEDYRKVMAINVDAIWLVLQTALPFLGRPAKKANMTAEKALKCCRKDGCALYGRIRNE